MSSKPSAALRALELALERADQITDKPEPLTVPRLIGLVREAIDSAEASEWEDYMGDDL